MQFIGGINEIHTGINLGRGSQDPTLFFLWQFCHCT